MRQHYNLGVDLRAEYVDLKNFIPKQFNHTNFKIIST